MFGKSTFFVINKLHYQFHAIIPPWNGTTRRTCGRLSRILPSRRCVRNPRRTSHSSARKRRRSSYVILCRSASYSHWSDKFQRRKSSAGNAAVRYVALRFPNNGSLPFANMSCDSSNSHQYTVASHYSSLYSCSLLLICHIKE